MKIAVAMRADHAKNDRVVNPMYLARLLLVSVGKSDGERGSPTPTIHSFIYAYGADWGNRAQYTYVWWGCGYCMSCPPTPFGIGQGLKYLRLKSPTAFGASSDVPPSVALSGCGVWSANIFRLAVGATPRPNRSGCLDARCFGEVLSALLQQQIEHLGLPTSS